METQEHQHQNQNRINVNVAPTYNMESTAGDQGFTNNPSSLIQTYNQYYNPHQTLMAASTDHNPNQYHVPFESAASSVSGFKSWLRQTPFNSSGHDNFHQTLSLTMSPSSQNGLAANIAAPMDVVDNVRKRPAVGKTLGAREPVPRKSIDTFGQRTSQYRGVTR